MKEKLLEALKTEYKNLGFGQKAFDGVADYLSKTIEKEEDISNAISGVGGLLKAFQGEVDTVRQEKSELQRKLEALNKEPDVGPKEPTKEPKDELLEQLLAKVEGLEKARQAEQKQKEFESRKKEVVAKAKEKGINEEVMAMIGIPEDLEDTDTFVADIAQRLVNAGVQVGKPRESQSEPKEMGDALADIINKKTEELIKQK